MILGTVNDRLEAVISVEVMGPHGATVTVDGVIDSGFSGMMSLPSATIAILDLSWKSAMQHRLADGSLRLFNVHRAEIYWDGVWRRISILKAETIPLLGMTLLESYHLQVQVRPGGAVMITPIVTEGDAAGETMVI